MKEEILSNQDNPEALERLYRSDRKKFGDCLGSIQDADSNELLRFWKIRLNYKEKPSTTSHNAWYVVLALCLLVAFLVKIPDITGVDKDPFFVRNVGLIIFPALILYLYYRNKTAGKTVLLLFTGALISAVYINLIPYEDSDSSTLAILHLPLLFWSALGIAFISPDYRSLEKRKEFLFYNANMLILIGIILIAGIILTLLTISLFEIADLRIGSWYMKNIVVIGLACAPVVATHLALNLDISKIAPIIARIFSPLVVITLCIFLGAVTINGSNPYSDREFLMVFNLTLIGVLALILFSIIEYDDTNRNGTTEIFLLMLAYCALLIDLVAFSAISYRIFEGNALTPNRLVVLGSNILFFIHLFRIAVNLTRLVADKTTPDKLKNSIVSYLPVYTIWTFIVVFILPLVFGFN